MGWEPSNSSGHILNQARRTQGDLGRSLTRLGSGLRINNASDDAAGLAVANQLKTQAAGFQQAVRNINDNVSRVSVADGALQTLSSVLARLTELAQVAQSGALSQAQRGAVDDEAQALRDEFNRIVINTEFNGQSLFVGNVSNETVQAGFGGTQNDRFQYGLSALGLAAGGSGAFTVAGTYSGIDYPYQIESTDLNGDGNEDVVVGGYSDSSVNVYLGNGDGTFRARVSYSPTGDVRGLAVEDLTGDGYADVLVTAGSGPIKLLRGNGDGTFQTAVTVASGATTNDSELFIADFNNDNILDFVHSRDTFTALHLGAGNGSFSVAQSFALTGTFRGREQSGGDIDGDGDVDLVVSTNTGTYLYKNNAGQFGSANLLSAGDNWSQTLGDIDADGDLDLAVGEQTTDTLRVLTNDGTGSFTLSATLTGTSSNNDIEIVDVTGDGRKDIIVSSLMTTPGMFVYAGNGSGGFSAAISTASAELTQFTLADFNNDGAMDVMAAAWTTDNLIFFRGVSTAVTRDFRVRPLDPISLVGTVSAQRAATALESMSTDLTIVQGAAAAAQSRLSSAASYALNSSIEITAAEDRIRSVDYAEEVARMTALQVLAEQQTAILAQANLQEQVVLRLMENV